MSFKRNLFLSTTGLILASHLAIADTTTQAIRSIDQLPKKGDINFIGTVEDVNNKNEFTVRDNKGKTIDVESTVTLQINKGDMVAVNGSIEDGFMGVGKAIEKATVTVIDSNNAAALTAEGSEAINANAMNNRKDNDRNHAQLGQSANTTQDRYTTQNASDAKKQAHGKNQGVYTTVEALPEEGKIIFKGLVDSVDDDKTRFILRDSTGETIDVKSKTPVSFTKGSIVQVHGTMQDEAANMGEEIAAESVQVLRQYSAANAQNNNEKGSMIRADKKNSSIYTSVNSLPENGYVVFKGVVDSIDDEKTRFVLSDSEGETIDVHTAKAVEFDKGDTVQVSGIMKDETMGLGEEITAKEVQIVQKGNSTHPGKY